MPESRQGGAAKVAKAAGAPDNEKPREVGPDPLIGRTVGGRFKVLSVIARGGMGKVYRAEQAPLGRVCALKVLSPKYDGDRDPEFHRRFLLEASTAAKLTHPNTVTIFDYGQEGEDLYFIAMEYIEGRTLHRVLREEAPLLEARVAHIAAQICRSLREAHQIGVVHRDLKPGNVLLTDKPDEQDVVKVLDFGLVKDVTGEAEDLTQAGLFMGSPKYMAPEQILGNEISPRTDIYSLGVMMYEMLCGKVPFDRGASVGTLMAHVNEPPPPMQANNPSINVSASMEVIVKKCLEKAPDNRYPTMKALLEALKRVGAGIVDTSEGLPAAFLESGPDSSVLAPLPAGPRVTAPSSSGVGARSDSGPQRPSFTGSSGNHPAPVFASPSVSESLVGPAPERTATVDAPAKPNRAWMGAALVAIVGIGVFGLLRTRNAASGAEPAATASASPSANAATSAKATASAAAAASASAAAAPTARKVRIDTEPQGATLTEDGVEKCASTPCDILYEGDALAKTHTLKATKKGMKPTKIEVAVGASSASAKLDVFTGAPQQPPAQGQRTNGGKTGADYKPSPY